MIEEQVLKDFFFLCFWASSTKSGRIFNLLPSYFVEHILTAGYSRELAVWLSAVRVSGKVGKGKIQFDAETIKELAALMGFSEKTVRNYLKRLLAAGWASHDPVSGKIYLRSMRSIMEKALGIVLDNSSPQLRYKAVLPESDEQWRAMIQNFKAYLYSVLIAGAVKSRTTVLKKVVRKKSQSRHICVALSEKTRRTKQASEFDIIRQNGYPVAGTEYFSPDNISLRFAGKCCGKHYTTISRYKARSKGNGWLDYKHRLHVVARFESSQYTPELAMIAAEASILPGFGIGRTQVYRNQEEGAYDLVVRLTDELIPMVQVKRNWGCFYAL